MENWKHVIADSGGSSTTWAFCRADGSVVYYETAGLHPKVVLDWKEKEIARLREELNGLPNGRLHFYGAGCSQEPVQQAMKAQLLQLGFDNVEVFPDTLAACRATCGNDPGLVAILGTGSVLVEYDGASIVNRIGGWGSIIGDEGSGFHFGRLVLRDYLGHPADISPEVEKIVGSESDVLKELASPTAQQWIAALAGKLSAIPLGPLHQANLKAFLSIYLPLTKRTYQTLSCVGSYGFYQQELLGQLLAENGMNSGVILREPMKQLVDFHR